MEKCENTTFDFSQFVAMKEDPAMIIDAQSVFVRAMSISLANDVIAKAEHNVEEHSEFLEKSVERLGMDLDDMRCTHYAFRLALYTETVVNILKELVRDYPDSVRDDVMTVISKKMATNYH